MARELMFFAFDEAAKCGPYDERPMLPGDTDLQLCESRNDRPQPFFLICEHDTVLVTMSGLGNVEFRNTNVLWHKYESGDFIYVPAGVPHKIVPSEESIHLRYKLPESELEGVAWFCGCGSEVHRDIWELSEELPQEGYSRATSEFNSDVARRTCPKCKTVHPQVDLAGIRWTEVAQSIRTAAINEQKGTGEEKP
jgi:3-hydroxyanthranilate 3,4-dioxygenase